MYTMAVKNYVIPPGSKILVTGANGYIASHVCDILLDLGYNVRGTVRSEKAWLDLFFERKYGPGRFETVTVPSLASEDAWKEILRGVSGIALLVWHHLHPSPCISRPNQWILPGIRPVNETELSRGYSLGN